MNYSYEHDFIYTCLAYIDIYSITFLLAFGSIFNSFYLAVILLARRRSPRIGGKKYLVVLTISSFLFLNLHYYIYTLPYIKHIYQIDDTNSLFKLNFIDSNEYVCKLFVYLRLASRCLFTYSTLGYSLERALAIFFPFKIMIYKNTVSKLIFVSAMFISFISPTFALYFFEIKNKSCEVDSSKWTIYAEMLFYFNLLTGVLPFFIIVFLNVSILIKLTKYEIIVTTLCSRSSKTNVKNEILKILNNIYEENFSLIQEKLIPFNHKLNFRKAFEHKGMHICASKKNQEKLENNKYSIMSKVTVEKSRSVNQTTSVVSTDTVTSSRRDLSKKKRQSFYVNHQFPNTNFFIRISLINMFLNIPYVLNVSVILNPYLHHLMGDIDALSRDNPYIFMYLVLTELISISKYSLTIFFFTFSNVFRFHLNDITKRHTTRVLRI